MYTVSCFSINPLVININHRVCASMPERSSRFEIAPFSRREILADLSRAKSSAKSPCFRKGTTRKKSTSVSPELSRSNLNNSATDTNLTRGLFARDGDALLPLMLGSLAIHKAARSLSGSMPRVLD